MARAKPHTVARPAPKPTTPRRAYWQAIVEECRRSGLRQGEFCRRRGIPPGTLSCWKHKLAHERAPAARAVAAVPARSAEPPAFLPVRITAGGGPSITTTPGRSTAAAVEIEIRLGPDRTVRVRGRVDPHWLGQAIQTLGALGC